MQRNAGSRDVDVWTIAPLLDVIGRDAEAALHRVSAAGCFAKSGELSRAANLYRAALAGPLSDAARADVERGAIDLPEAAPSGHD